MVCVYFTSVRVCVSVGEQHRVAFGCLFFYVLFRAADTRQWLIGRFKNDAIKKPVVDCFEIKTR